MVPRISGGSCERRISFYWGGTLYTTDCNFNKDPLGRPCDNEHVFTLSTKTENRITFR